MSGPHPAQGEPAGTDRNATARSSQLTIGGVAKQVGLTTRTIRYYEDIGLLNSVRRLEGGRRTYTDDDVRRLKFIKRLKLLGLTLEEMKELEGLYLTHRSNDQVLLRLLEVLDRHMTTITSRIEELKILQRDIEAYQDHIRSKI